jgi:hypothetical protein
MEKTRRNRIILVIGLGMLVAVIVAGYFPKGYFLSGFGGTHKHKTLWDWLNLAGVVAVPLVLAWFGFRLQLQQQQQTKEQLENEREITDKNRQQDLEIAQGTREEEALQHYLDRVSNLVIEKNLLAIAAKKEPTTEEKELLDVSVDILRGLTLSTLRRLSDGVRKASVVRLLIETDIIKRLEVSLEGANLSDADLSYAYLNGANLRRAVLTDADLECAYLTDADLGGAVLSGAVLSHAVLLGANLLSANLNNAKGLTKEQLEDAYLCKTTLPKEIGVDPNRDCSKPYDEWLSEQMDQSKWKCLSKKGKPSRYRSNP